MASEEKENEKKFVQELQGIQIQMPGSGGKTVSLLDDDVMLKMVHKQYPEWKDTGKVTSIPVARIPKLFLHNLQMEKSLQTIFKSTQKGDEAEKKLYKLFMEGDFSGQPGMLVFPNFDGSHIFEIQVAKVEIDMILVHQTKGVFIFNVKNVGGKSAAPAKMKKDIEKHRKFAQMLAQDEKRGKRILVHTIVCNFFDGSNKFKELAEETRNLDEKIIVFNKDGLHTAKFLESWNEALNTHGIENISNPLELDVLVARLIALSSLESSLALIHEQMASGFLQSVKEKKHLETQMKSCCQNPEMLETIAE